MPEVLRIDEALTDVEAKIVRQVRFAKHEAEVAKRTRMAQSRRNLDAYFGRQDWSHKQSGQSQEFLPKVAMALEQFRSFVKRALVDFGDWFTLEMPEVPGLEPTDIAKFLSAKIDTLSYNSEERIDFATLVTDGITVGALESLVIFKVHGRMAQERRFTVERGTEFLETPLGAIPQPVEELVQQVVEEWQLCIDLVSPTDYYPDPTGNMLYEVHRVERDLWQVQALAEGDDPIYDPDIVAEIEGSMRIPDDERRRDTHRGQDEAPEPSHRRKVVLDEFWGTLLDTDGRKIESNTLLTIANDQYLIRAPEPNPNWHGQSPFVACPLVRVPLSVWHKALMDHAVDLNLSLNELYNLMLDGGMASVWGTRQLKKDWLEDPRQVEDGIPFGTTLLIKEEVPAGARVLETVSTGDVPQEAMAMFNLSDREFQVASIINDLKLGVLPPKSVKATEIIEAQQGQAGMIDGIIRDIEDRLIEPTLRKAWLTILQHYDQFNVREVATLMGEQAALVMARMSPAQRYTTFAQGSRFKVNGLSASLARVRDFQKLLTLLEVATSNPIMLQAFQQRGYSFGKIIDRLFKTLNIDPATIEADPEEQAAQQAPVAQQAQPTGAAPPTPGAPVTPQQVPTTEGAEVPAATDQLSLMLGG